MVGPGKSCKPLVTVCITTFNRVDLLPYTIESVIKQSYDNIEIIIVDDCSQDETSKVVSEFMKREHRIKYIRHKNRKGLAAARNSAIFDATGKYFTFVDDDDLWDQDFIKKFTELAVGYGDDYVFCCGIKVPYRNGTKICFAPRFDAELVEHIRNGYVPPFSAQFYVTDELKKIGGYTEAIKSGVDHDLWLKLAFNGYRIKSLEECLVMMNPIAKQNMNRMTTDWDKRFKGIEESLQIWKHDIERHLGEDFYRHFEKEYYYYLHKCFFKQNLKRIKLKPALEFFLRCRSRNRLLIEVAIRTFRKIFLYMTLRNNRQIRIECGPSFRPFKRGLSINKS